MSHLPNKPTLVAAALYGAAALPAKDDAKAKPAAVWSDLSEDQRKPFVDASSYLLGQTFGVAPHLVNRAGLAKSFDTQQFAAFSKVPSEVVVSLFVNIVSVLP